MRSDLQDNQAQQMRLGSVLVGTTQTVLTGNVTLTHESPIFNAHDANGSDRTITLPAAARGRAFMFANIGTANTLTVKNASASTIVVVRPGEFNLVISTETSWASSPDVFGASGASHSTGLVPDPGAVAGTTAFLREDGVWAVPSGGGGGGVTDVYGHITDGSTTANAAGDDTFKIRSSSGKVTVAVGSNDVTHGDNVNLSVNESAVDHNSLLNFDANKHVDHTGVSISTAANSGLAGGGTIAATRTLTLDVNNLTADTPVLADSFAFYDASGSDTNKATLTVLNGVLDHNALLNYSANRHIDHTGVSIIAGTALSGGGTIDSSRTLNLDINGLSADTIATGDFLIFYDISGSDTNKITLANLNASLDYTTLLNKLVVGVDVQAFDSDLTAVAGLSSTGLIARTGSGTASVRTITGPAAGITVSNGDGVSGNPTLALANDLGGLEGLAANGIAARTGTDTWSVRTLTAPAAGITVTNGDGVSGNPTLVLANDLSALEGLSSNGIVTRTATDTMTVRTLTSGTGVTVTNGSGVSGNPTFDVDQTALKPKETLIIACSDETTALTTGTAKVTFRMPYAFTVSDIRASLSTAQTSGSIFTVDVNESGTTIISTKLTIDNTEKTTQTAATPRVISDSSLADDAEMTIDIDQVGDGTAKGLKVTIIGSRT